MGAGRKYGDDVAGAARKYGDDVAGAARRNAADMAKTAAREAAQAAARKAAAAARAPAERLARMKAVTARAKAAISHAVKNNPMPILQAALKPRIALKDLVSSSANLPARMVAAVAENVQDVNKVWDTIKATIIKPGVSVIQSVGEQMVSDFANSQVPGLGDLIGLFGPNRKRGNDKAKDAGAQGRNEAGAACPIRRSKNSFTGDTTVLMADGSRKLIRDLRDGDLVLATNPKTGKTEGRRVTDVRRYLTDATVHQLEVKSEKGTGKILVTDEHPFWVPDLGRWLGAEDLKPGYRFLTADNKPATVSGTRSFSGIRLVYNLTVDGLHTYYVGAGGPGKAAAADVLVHNDDENNGPACGSSGDGPQLIAGPELGVLTVPANEFDGDELAGAWHMAAKGHRVELRDPVGEKKDGKTSDLVVDGVNWDVYSPSTTNMDRLSSQTSKKGKQVHGGGVIINLASSPFSAQDVLDANVPYRVMNTSSNVRGVEVMDPWIRPVPRKKN